MYEIFVRKKARKNIEKAPKSVQVLFADLLQDLKQNRSNAAVLAEF